jgi:hypothetical protein
MQESAPTPPDIEAILRKRRPEVLRIVQALQELATAGTAAVAPVTILKGKLRYRGASLCLDSILADMLAPEEPLSGEVFPEDMRDICDLIDSREHYAKWDPRLEDVPSVKDLFSQLAQFLYDLACIR